MQFTENCRVFVEVSFGCIQLYQKKNLEVPFDLSVTYFNVLDLSVLFSVN